MDRPIDIRVTVPNSQATLYFDDYKTRSTGTERFYASPALPPGTYNYHVKVVYNQDGHQMRQDRWVTVVPGWPVAIDFAATVSHGVSVKNGR